jgi:hypothetical protein
MIAAYRLKGIGWFGGCVMVTLGFYLVSLQVAAERKKLETLDGRIAVARRDIRSLETEFDTRANLTQLERWNGDTLALAAPQAAQFVADEAQLAAIDARQPLPDGPAVKTAALVVPSMPAAASNAPAAPAPVAVAVARPAPARPQATTMVASAKSLVPSKMRVAAEKVAFTPAIARVATMIRPAVALRVKPEVALLDRKLLSDRTLGDLLSGARAEKGHRR